MYDIMVGYIVLSIFLGLIIISESWNKNSVIFHDLKLKRKHSALITLFWPIVVFVSIPLFVMWLIWLLCSGIAKLITIATDE